MHYGSKLKVSRKIDTCSLNFHAPEAYYALTGMA